MIEMKTIPNGVIHMRDNRTNRRWTIPIKPFLIGIYPIINRQYYYEQEFGNRNDVECPVTDISWFDAIEFCNKLSRKENLLPYYIYDKKTYEVSENIDATGYRLPNEAEWEYACRAGDNSYRYGELDDIAWHNNNSDGKLHNVGMKIPNSWGIYDMLGNVWEWCNDIYDIEKYGIYRTFRGGSWADNPRASGASCRRRSHPTVNLEDLGFRICRSI